MEIAGITPQLRFAILAYLASRRPISTGGAGDVVEGRLLMTGTEDAIAGAAAARRDDSAQLELLGAFFEGRLATDERAEVLRWLAEDPDCYAAYISLAKIENESSLIDWVDQ